MTDIKIDGAGEVIRRCRTDASLTQTDLAKALEMPLSTLCRYENDDRPLTIEIICRIAGACNHSKEQLAFDCVSTAIPEFGETRFGKSLQAVLKLFVTTCTF